MTNKIFLEKLEAINPKLEPMEQFVHSLTPMNFRCKTCGTIFEKRPDHVLYKKVLCPKCLAEQNILKYGSDRIIRSDVPKRLKSIFKGIKDRCLKEWDDGYERYGGRGISICKEWLQSSSKFYDWALSNGYADNLSIDRIDPNGDYTPENCRWVDAKTQGNNRTNNIIIERDGIKLTLSQWCEKLGINYSRLYYKIKTCRNPDIPKIIDQMVLERDQRLKTL